MFHRKPPGERPIREDRLKGQLLIVALLILGGQGYSDWQNHESLRRIATVQDFDHTQTLNQLKAASQAPGQLMQIEAEVVCPILTALDSFHPTSQRDALVKKYCVKWRVP